MAAVDQNDLGTVKGVCALHCGSPFRVCFLGQQRRRQGGRSRELPSSGRRPLPAEAMEKLVEILFQGKARWNHATGALDDVVKPASAMMDTTAMPATATNLPP